MAMMQITERNCGVVVSIIINIYTMCVYTMYTMYTMYGYFQDQSRHLRGSFGSKKPQLNWGEKSAKVTFECPSFVIT